MGVEERTVNGALCIVLAFAVLLVPGASIALGSLRLPSTEEAVSGARGILGPAFARHSRGADSTAARRGPVMIRIGEEQMYGIPGLHTSGVLVGVRVKKVFMTGEAAQLSSPVGSEARLALTAAASAESWAVSVGCAYDAVALDGLSGTNLMSVNAASFVWLTPSVRAGGSVERLRITGEEYPGADVLFVLSVQPTRYVALYGTMELDRRFGAVPGAAMTVEGLGPARVSIGYESGPDALKGSFTVSWRSVDLSIGVYYHPVLGEKRGITLTWYG